jgi:hypothetical protein
LPDAKCQKVFIAIFIFLFFKVSGILAKSFCFALRKKFLPEKSQTLKNLFTNQKLFWHPGKKVSGVLKNIFVKTFWLTRNFLPGA